jgi:hypothetical protein
VTLAADGPLTLSDRRHYRLRRNKQGPPWCGGRDGNHLISKEFATRLLCITKILQNFYRPAKPTGTLKKPGSSSAIGFLYWTD